MRAGDNLAALTADLSAEPVAAWLARPPARTASGSPTRPQVPNRRRPLARAAAGSGGCLILAAAAVIGAVVEALVGELSGAVETAEARHAAAQALTLFALRGLGVADARARGLVVQAG